MLELSSTVTDVELLDGEEEPAADEELGALLVEPVADGTSSPPVVMFETAAELEELGARLELVAPTAELFAAVDVVLALAVVVLGLAKLVFSFAPVIVLVEPVVTAPFVAF